MAQTKLSLDLSFEEARAVQILIDNYVRGGYNPISKALFEVLEALEETLPEVERYYGKWNDNGDNDTGINFSGETDMWN